MIIKEAKFVISNTNPAQCPAPDVPEYAFIGRSNVGKSSLINMLTNQKGLAKISGTPGKTRLINHFKINDTWYLVDLPGYGYAKISKSERVKWEKMIRDYLRFRQNLYCVFVLIDIRHEPQKLDLEFIQWLGKTMVPFAMIFTKADKLKPEAVETSVEAYKEKMLEKWDELPKMFITSAENKLGQTDVLQYIADINENN